MYFDHSIHVQKGIGCTSCHGQIDKMPFTFQAHSLLMEWCLDCHRHPGREIRPRGAVFSMKYRPPPDELALGERLMKEYNIHDATFAPAARFAIDELAKNLGPRISPVSRKREAVRDRIFVHADELANTEAFQELMRLEFPEQADIWPDSLSRRNFLTLMGASSSWPVSAAVRSNRPRCRRSFRTSIHRATLWQASPSFCDDHVVCRIGRRSARRKSHGSADKN